MRGVLQERVYRKSVKTDELKLRLIEAWLGIQQSVADQAIGECMCQSKRKAYWKHAMMCCSTTVNNLWNLHSVIFCFTTFNESSFSSGSGCLTIFHTFIEFHTVKNTWSANVKFLHHFVTNTIHSGNCLRKIGILDLSLIKLLQNKQGCNFFASQCSLSYRT